MRYVLNGGQELVDEVDRGGGRLDSEGYGVLSEVIAREDEVGSTQTKREGSFRKRWPHCRNDRQRRAGGPLVGAIDSTAAGHVEE